MYHTLAVSCPENPLHARLMCDSVRVTPGWDNGYTDNLFDRIFAIQQFEGTSRVATKGPMPITEEGLEASKPAVTGHIHPRA